MVGDWHRRLRGGDAVWVLPTLGAQEESVWSPPGSPARCVACIAERSLRWTGTTDHDANVLAKSAESHGPWEV